MWENMKYTMTEHERVAKQKEYEENANKSNIELSLLSFTHVVPNAISLSSVEYNRKKNLIMTGYSFPCNYKQ